MLQLSLWRLCLWRVFLDAQPKICLLRGITQVRALLNSLWAPFHSPTSFLFPSPAAVPGDGHQLAGGDHFLRVGSQHRLVHLRRVQLLPGECRPHAGHSNTVVSISYLTPSLISVFSINYLFFSAQLSYYSVDYSQDSSKCVI